MQEHFVGTGITPQIATYSVGNRTLRYAATGADTLPAVIFVHGAPGGLDAFIDYLSDSTLVPLARLVSVDRPGYGFSGLGNWETSIQEQARLIAPLLQQGRGKPILVGHSLGGPIVARMAMDYPDQVGGIIMLAPAIDPQNEKIWLASYPTHWRLVRWAVPKPIRVTNAEKLSHVKELKKMLPLWQNLKVPVVHLHGPKDWIVPPANLDFAQRMVPPAVFTKVDLAGASHFIPWTHKDTVVAHIKALLPKKE